MLFKIKHIKIVLLTAALDRKDESVLCSVLRHANQRLLPFYHGIILVRPRNLMIT
jgi:hypothetical protein